MVVYLFVPFKGEGGIEFSKLSKYENSRKCITGAENLMPFLLTPMRSEERAESMLF